MLECQSLEIEMSKSAYDVARDSLTTIEFFRVPYSSSDSFQRIFAEVLMTVRLAGRNSVNQGDKKFLLGFADTLEEASKPGE
jgi:hypothetical protein